LQKEIRAKEAQIRDWEEWIGDLQEEICAKEARIRNLTQNILIKKIKQLSGF
jgi:hypothetical protein